MIGALFALLLAAEAPAEKQSIRPVVPDLNNSRSGALPSDEKDAAEAYRFGICMGGNVTGIGRVLSMLPDSIAADKILMSSVFSMRTCVQSILDYSRFAPRIYRGLIAEVFYRDQFIGHGSASRKRRLELYKEPDRAAAAQLDKFELLGVMMVGAGVCVDKANHADVVHLLESKVNSAEENAAFAALRPALADCIPPGVKVKFSKLLMRGYLAEGAYRSAVLQEAAGT